MRFMRKPKYWIALLSITYSTLAKTQEFENWEKEADVELAAFIEQSNNDMKAFINGWDNDFFSIQELQNQSPAAETILVQNNSMESSTESQAVSVTSGINLWAVVVGVGSYAVEANNLKYADDDAQRFARFLASPAGGEVPEERLFMHIDEDATQQAVYKTLEYVLGHAKENDGVIFYFSGHGSPSAFILHDYGSPSFYLEDGKPIAVVDQRKGRLSHRYLNHLIANSKARYKYCVIDACHAGSMLESKAKSISELSKLDAFYGELDKTKSGSVFMLSSMESEVSWEARNQEVNMRGGYFTHYLMEGIRGKADYNQDQIITVVEAFDYCKRRVMAASGEKQNPVISGQYSFHMPFGVVRNQLKNR